MENEDSLSENDEDAVQTTRKPRRPSKASDKGSKKPTKVGQIKRK